MAVSYGFETLGRNEVNEKIGRGESLSGANLSGADLSGLVLRGADLRDADLEDSRCAGTVLDNALLTGARCSRADFTGASLVSATMNDAVFINARFTESDLSGAVLDHALMREADLSKANLSGARMEGVILEQAGLAEARLTDGFLAGCLLMKACADGADFSRSDLSSAIFMETHMGKALFAGVRASTIMLWDVNGEGCDFSESDFNTIQVGGVTVLRNSDFTRTRITKASFMSADLSGCIFRECVIIGSLLEKCDLSHTCFYHADTRETRFNKSNLEGADMRGINLFNGSLRKARLTNTDLRGANLYGAELYKAVFGNTQLEKANVKMTLLSKRTEFLS